MFNNGYNGKRIVKMIDKNRIFVIDNKRIAYFLIFVSMFIFTEIGRKIYRPYIYSNEIFDYWIADTIGNLTGTIAIFFTKKHSGLERYYCNINCRVDFLGHL